MTIYLMTALLAAFANYIAKLSFTPTTEKVHLPRDPKNDLFFDKINRKNVEIYRITSSIGAFFTVLGFAYSNMVGLIVFIIISPPFIFYYITLVRSHFLLYKHYDYYTREFDEEERKKREKRKRN